MAQTFDIHGIKLSPELVMWRMPPTHFDTNAPPIWGYIKLITW